MKRELDRQKGFVLPWLPTARQRKRQRSRRGRRRKAVGVCRGEEWEEGEERRGREKAARDGGRWRREERLWREGQGEAMLGKGCCQKQLLSNTQKRL